MSTKATPLVDYRRLATRTTVAALVFVDLAIVLTGARFPLRNPDTYFHLRFGEEFTHHWSITDPGHPGATSTGHWVPTQWLAEIVWSWIYDRAGAAGLCMLYAALLTAFLTGCYFTARTLAAPVPSLAAATLAFAGSLHWMGLRPQLISYVLIAITLAAWHRARLSGRRPWWLVPLTWIWAMCHGMWVLGIAIGVCAAAGIALEQRDLRAGLRQVAVPVASLFAAALTPVGPSLVLAVVDVGTRSSHFAEWAPVPLLHGWGLPLTVTVGALVVLRVRRGPTPPYVVVMIVLAVGFAAYSGRTLVAALLVATPLLAGEIGQGRAFHPLRRREAVAVGALCVAGLVAGALAAIHPGTALDEALQPFATDLDRLAPGTVMITDRSTGSVLLDTNPSLDVPIQGYADVLTDSELNRYDGVSNLAPGWITTLHELGARYALVNPASALAYALRRELGWRTVRGDDELVLLREARIGGQKGGRR